MLMNRSFGGREQTFKRRKRCDRSIFVVGKELPRHHQAVEGMGWSHVVMHCVIMDTIVLLTLPLIPHGIDRCFFLLCFFFFF